MLNTAGAKPRCFGGPRKDFCFLQRTVDFKQQVSGSDFYFEKISLLLCGRQTMAGGYRARLNAGGVQRIAPRILTCCIDGWLGIRCEEHGKRIRFVQEDHSFGLQHVELEMPLSYLSGH